MDWQFAISKNREALAVVVAGLIAMARAPISPLEGEMSAKPTEGGEDAGAEAPPSALSGGRVEPRVSPRPADPTSRGEIVRANKTLSRPLHRAILRILRPAEAALRRLIVIVAALAATASPTRGRFAAKRPLPDFSAFARHDRLPSFPLIDPRKRFGPAARPTGSGAPRISVPGLFDGICLAKPGEPLDAAALLRRIRKLQYVLHTLPRQARRLNRLMARRATAKSGPGRAGPIRPGHPPGHRRRPRHPVDDILRDCHWLARQSGFKPP